MVFETKLSTIDTVNEMYKKAMEELSEWYEFNWDDNTPKIFVIDDRETFHSLSGGSKEDWVRGFGDYCNNIFVYSPEAQEKFTIHKYREEDYYRFIKHELDHRFFYMYTKGLRYPKWLVEGHAGYVTGQIKYSDPIVRFEKFLEMDKSMQGSAYAECGHAVKLLIDKVGKKSFLAFISGLGGKDFKSEFNKTFKMELTYEDFGKNIY